MNKKEQKQSKNKRTKRVTIVITEDEKIKLEESAKNDDRTVSSFIVRLLREKGAI